MRVGAVDAVAVNDDDEVEEEEEEDSRKAEAPWRRARSSDSSMSRSSRGGVRSTAAEEGIAPQKLIRPPPAAGLAVRPPYCWYMCVGKK
jgi:hypothetical protein